ncbi:MAG: 50S ribosomal protein L25/general stress protein Ctc [Chromatiales bacterium]|nr:50S ribosomal protein L25/general stress protein Ctc [Chromatiales bacterium]
MAHQFSLAAETRRDAGKGASRRLRREGKIPGIMYGGGQPPTGVAFDANALHRNMAEEAFLSSILTVTLDGQAMQAIVRDYQPHPARRAVLHLDLQRIVATEKLRMTIPLHFINEELSPGVKLGGGSVSHLLTELEISCLPKDLPEYIEIDIGPLQLNDMLHIRDLKLPEGVEVPGFEANTDSDLPVVHVHVLRAVEEPAAEGAAEGAAAAPAAGDKAAAPAEKAGDKAAADKAKPAAKGDKK